MVQVSVIRENVLHVCPLEKKYLEMYYRSKIKLKKKTKFGRGPSLYKSAGNEHGSKLHVKARLNRSYSGFEIVRMPGIT